MSKRTVIVGAGQGGLQVAESLRSFKYDGEIVLCGEETYLPYNRPPLSKGFLLGDLSLEQLTIRQESVFDKKNINLRLGSRVNSVDTKANCIHFDGGDKLSYTNLVMATGATPRPMPIDNADAQGVHSLRTLDDTKAIQSSMISATHIVVVGGGFIGLEMAAVAKKLGKKVTVVEFADRLMARVVSPEISKFYYELHKKHGCNILLKTGVSALNVNEAGKIKSVSLSNGEELNTELVVLGIGVIPSTSLAEQAGIECDQGIITDQSGRTNIQNILAIGDCATQLQEDGSKRRLESVQNAVEMAKACATAIVGQEKPFIAAPWFWSDQYDIKLQMVGLSAGYDNIILRGSIDSRTFSYFYFKENKLLAIDSINSPGDHMVGRKLLNGENTLTLEQAANTEFVLKNALAS